mgnify:CR=1 FL=1
MKKFILPVILFSLSLHAVCVFFKIVFNVLNIFFFTIQMRRSVFSVLALVLAMGVATALAGGYGSSGYDSGYGMYGGGYSSGYGGGYGG